MDSFIHVSGWSQHMPHSPKAFGHARSLSSVPTSTPSSSSPPYRPKPLLKSTSTSNLPIIALSTNTVFFPNNEMSTLPDPRTRALSPPTDSGRASPSRSPSPSPGAGDQHPDLSDEVATLSTKLINAINHQTVLDDTLSATRHELETARERIRDLEGQVASQRDMMSGEVWVRRSTLETERKTMQAEKRVIQAKLTEESGKRIETEKGKRKIEQELENLTTALFEEANKMVIGAKEEAKHQHDSLQRRNDQLKAQLADSESLLKSHQEQLSELKQVLETMVLERDDQTNTAPSSPGAARPDSKDDDGSLPDGLSPVSTFAHPEGHAPAPPTSFTYLLQPVLRNDLAAYDDFLLLARLSHKRTGSRASSGSIGGLIGLGGSTSSAHPSNGSATSLNTATGSAPQSPNTPASTTSTSSNTPSSLPHLKDTRFFKRVLSEDVEATLRLDMAPGLSWLARRTVLSSMTEGSLVVEPVPVSTSYVPVVKPQHYPCSLCGESRKDETHLRNYRFRTSETDSAQRYPLCGYCLGRVRSTCQFLGFLRMVKDGYWRADDEDHEKAAWEESVRLREQMFWSRIGGGVVPISPEVVQQAGMRVEVHSEQVSPRTSLQQDNAAEDASGDLAASDILKPPSMDDDASNYELEQRVSAEEPRTPSRQPDGASLHYSVKSLSLDASNSETGSVRKVSMATAEEDDRSIAS